jgi:hypothetical protein
MTGVFVRFSDPSIEVRKPWQRDLDPRGQVLLPSLDRRQPQLAARQEPPGVKCYKTFYGRNLQMFMISYNVCPSKDILAH